MLKINHFDFFLHTIQITMSFSVPFKSHFEYNPSFHIKNHLRTMTFCILYIDKTILLIINKAIQFFTANRSV